MNPADGASAPAANPPRRHPEPGEARSSLHLLAAEALVFPTGILAAALITRVLGADGYGLFILSLGAALWVELAIGAFFSRSAVKLIGEADDPAAVAGAAARLQVATGLAAMLLMWAAAGPLADLLGEPRLVFLVRLAAVDVPLTALSSAYRNTLVGTGRFAQRARVAAGRWLARLALIALFVLAGLGVEGALLGCIGATAVEAFLARPGLPLFRRASRGALRPLISWSLPLFVYGVGLSLYAKLPLYGVKALGASTGEAGLYAAASGAAASFEFGSVVLAPLLTSSLSRRRAAGRRWEARKLARDALRFALLPLPLIALAAVEAPRLLALVYGGPFAAAAPVLRWLLLAAAAHVTIGVSVAALVAAGRPRRMIVLGLAPPAAVAALLFAAVPRFGMVGAAAATAAVSLLTAAVAAWWVAAAWGVRLPAATAARTLTAVGLSGGAAVLWPSAGGLATLLELAVLAAAAAALIVLSGELDGSELHRVAGYARRLLRLPAAGGGDWDRVPARLDRRGHYLDAFLGRLKRREHVELLRRWLDGGAARRTGWVLKTDLFEEAMGEDALLPALARRGGRTLGIDGSAAVVARAARRQRTRRGGGRGCFVAADLRALPLRPGSLALAVSPSSLDHFRDPADLHRSLRELRGALAADGRLVVTLDNRGNVTDPLLRLASALGLAPYFLGRSYTARELREELADAGFEVLGESTLLHNPRLAAAGAAAMARRLGRPAAERWVRRRLLAARRWRGTPLRHFTASFVAALAAPRPEGGGGAISGPDAPGPGPSGCRSTPPPHR
jgi:O-antigen/teichoic acid export membrane protein/SAM-dependent methyltransferase